MAETPQKVSECEYNCFLFDIFSPSSARRESKSSVRVNTTLTEALKRICLYVRSATRDLLILRKQRKMWKGSRRKSAVFISPWNMGVCGVEVKYVRVPWKRLGFLSPLSSSRAIFETPRTRLLNEEKLASTSSPKIWTCRESKTMCPRVKLTAYRLTLSMKMQTRRSKNANAMRTHWISRDVLLSVLWLRHDLSDHITPRGISATRNMKSRLAIKFPTPYE